MKNWNDGYHLFIVIIIFILVNIIIFIFNKGTFYVYLISHSMGSYCTKTLTHFFYTKYVCIFSKERNSCFNCKQVTYVPYPNWKYQLFLSIVLYCCTHNHHYWSSFFPWKKNWRNKREDVQWFGYRVLYHAPSTYTCRSWWPATTRKIIN